MTPKQKVLDLLNKMNNKEINHNEWLDIISKGFQIKDYRWVEHDFIGEVKEEYQRPYTEDWIKTEFITDIDFEEGQQITIPL